MDHDGAETNATRGDLRPSANHPRPILRPNYVPKFASKPLTFIGRPERERERRPSMRSHLGEWRSARLPARSAFVLRPSVRGEWSAARARSSMGESSCVRRGLTKAGCSI